MVGNDFVGWVIEKVKCSPKTARDAASRCRRVERLLNVKLDDAIRNESGFKTIRARLEKEKSLYIKRAMNERVAKATLVRAVKLYHQFLNSK
jgi:hypothetical protein